MQSSIRFSKVSLHRLLPCVFTRQGSKGIYSRLLSGMILIDLQKVFDTIDLKILIKSILLSISISKHAYVLGIEPDSYLYIFQRCCKCY